MQNYGDYFWCCCYRVVVVVLVAACEVRQKELRTYINVL